jgi:hypothetical protein
MLPAEEQNQAGCFLNNWVQVCLHSGRKLGRSFAVTTEANGRGDDNDPQGEINIAIRLRDGTILWPVQRVMKRFKNGVEDSIWVYGVVLFSAH